ncbi:MAG: hypothetical protein FIA97_13820 [Methylococcaceae bacterium]|nr:hypothetical protein [Methylococcaceae bacterium]
MATTTSRRSVTVISLIVLGLVSLGPPAMAQVYRGGVSVSHARASKAATFSPHNLARLTDAMRSHNARLRLLLADRDRELKSVKAKLRQVQEQQEMADTGGIYPLFIATP